MESVEPVSSRDVLPFPTGEIKILSPTFLSDEASSYTEKTQPKITKSAKNQPEMRESFYGRSGCTNNDQ